MKTTRNLLIVILLVISLAFVGCQENDIIGEDNGNGTQDEGDNRVEIPDPDFGGTIQLSITNPETLNPIQNKDRDIDQFLQLVYEPLFVLNEEEKPVPNLIETYTISDSGTYIDIKLKENLHWHDGEPIVAGDIIFTYEALRAADLDVVYKKCVENIARMSKLDEDEVRVYFNQESILNVYAFLFPIIPEHYYEGNLNNDSNASMSPVGSGMYQFDAFVSNNSIELSRNDNWLGGDIYIDKVIGNVIHDNDAKAESFKQNLTHVFNPSILNWQNYSDREKIKTMTYTTYYYDFIGFNFDNNVLDNQGIRQAIAFAIDREAIVNTLYVGNGVVSDVPLHPNSWLGESIDNHYALDVEEASNLLEQNGWSEKNEEGILTSGASTLSFDLLVNQNDSIKLELANLIEEQLHDIGIEIIVNPVDYESYQNALMEGNYDMVLGAWKLSPIPDLSFAFHSDSNPQYNFINYSDPQMDSLLNNAYRSFNEEDALTAYDELLSYIQTELPYFSLFFNDSATFLGQDVFGELKPNTYNVYKDFNHLYMNLD
ncbi:peptide/nickel transport system substrate-binding protein [Natranaerovirga hydrolytica]|uniref:Peptide/nickel transport system substrate-binding protein n=1 Tax=Natranaerovirga hydrolytica TaxID=680378 RepID=A0A4V2Q1M7_9FIRM|nr:peptide ABC transporter substrate-binding protein [Natranaerovirga hydrolytica]TCK98201.1 peptide/nickel transport system substrate-binding protein [Natranaerovirga hydrolytica]